MCQWCLLWLTTMCEKTRNISNFHSLLTHLLHAAIYAPVSHNKHEIYPASTLITFTGGLIISSVVIEELERLCILAVAIRMELWTRSYRFYLLSPTPTSAHWHWFLEEDFRRYWFSPHWSCYEKDSKMFSNYVLCWVIRNLEKPRHSFTNN